MLNKNNIIFLTSLVTLFSAPLMAADQIAEPVWKGEAELGFVSTSGNTDTETLNAKAKVSNDLSREKTGYSRFRQFPYNQFLRQHQYFQYFQYVFCILQNILSIIVIIYFT